MTQQQYKPNQRVRFTKPDSSVVVGTEATLVEPSISLFEGEGAWKIVTDEGPAYWQESFFEPLNSSEEPEPEPSSQPTTTLSEEELEDLEGVIEEYHPRKYVPIRQSEAMSLIAEVRRLRVENEELKPKRCTTCNRTWGHSSECFRVGNAPKKLLSNGDLTANLYALSGHLDACLDSLGHTDVHFEQWLLDFFADQQGIPPVIEQQEQGEEK